MVGKMITKKEVLADLEAIVEEYGGDTTYRNRDKSFYANGGCRYADRSGNDKCIVGAWMKKKGIDLKKIARKDTNNHPVHFPDVLQFIEEETGRKFASNQALDVLKKVQMIQDNNFTWGGALMNAKSKGNL